MGPVIEPRVATIVTGTASVVPRAYAGAIVISTRPFGSCVGTTNVVVVRGGAGWRIESRLIAFKP